MRFEILLCISSCSAFSGPQRHQQMKAEARMNTISTLLGQESGPMNQNNQTALQNLLKTDTYKSQRFSDDHTTFKSTHNDVFVQLIRHCSKPKPSPEDLSRDLDSIPSYHPVFYLDGADGASTIALRNAGTYRPHPLLLPLSLSFLTLSFTHIYAPSHRYDQSLHHVALLLYESVCMFLTLFLTLPLTQVYAQTNCTWQISSKIQVTPCFPL